MRFTAEIIILKNGRVAPILIIEILPFENKKERGRSLSKFMAIFVNTM
jgi:hypothetical protein